MEITESFIKKNNTIYKHQQYPETIPQEIIDSIQAPRHGAKATAKTLVIDPRSATKVPSSTGYTARPKAGRDSIAGTLD